MKTFHHSDVMLKGPLSHHPFPKPLATASNGPHIFCAILLVGNTHICLHTSLLPTGVILLPPFTTKEIHSETLQSRCPQPMPHKLDPAHMEPELARQVCHVPDGERQSRFPVPWTCRFPVSPELVGFPIQCMANWEGSFTFQI